MDDPDTPAEAEGTDLFALEDLEDAIHVRLNVAPSGPFGEVRVLILKFNEK